MKKLKMMSLLIVSLFSLNVLAGDITIKVNGMVCSMCAQGIQKKFSALDIVQEIKVDLDSKTVYLKMKDKQDIDDTKIKEIITEAGYNVSSIERK